MPLDSAKLFDLVQNDPRHVEALAKLAGYESVPPGIDQFIEDPYYLGGVLADAEGKSGVYPYWREALRKVFPSPFYSPYLEVIATGSIGRGKSTFSSIGVAYDICKLLHLKHPHSYYNLLASTKIVTALMNATMDLAAGVLWDQLSMWFAQSPFFKQQMAKAGRRADDTLFPKNIDVQQGSRQVHALGKAIVSAILSELNFQSVYANQAFNNYNAIRTRMKSRFMTNLGYPGRVWIDTSKNESGSFVEEYVMKDRANDPEMIIFDGPIWEVMEFKGIYSNGAKPYKTFDCFVGDDTRDPFLIRSPEQLEIIDPERVLAVPVEYRGEFERDLPTALRDLAGVSTYSSYKFIHSVEKIESAFTRDNPVTKEIIILDFYDKEDQIIKYFDWSKLSRSTRPRYIHIDLGITNDHCGIACTFVDNIVRTEKIDPITQKTMQVRQPIFCNDFVVCVEAKPGQEIPIYKVRQLLLEMRHRGYPIAGVSMDGFQSAELKQDLILEGFDANVVSVDKNNDAYNTFKRAVIEDRHALCNHELLRKEIKELQSTRGKVDHPRGGSKDLSDAVAGATFGAFMKLGTVYGEENVSFALQMLEGLSKKKSDYEMIAQFSRGSSPSRDSYFRYSR